MAAAKAVRPLAHGARPRQAGEVQQVAQPRGTWRLARQVGALPPVGFGVARRARIGLLAYPLLTLILGIIAGLRERPGWFLTVTLVPLALAAVRVHAVHYFEQVYDKSPRLWSLAFFAASVAAHLLVSRYDSPLLYLLRIAMTISVAGIFGASITVSRARCRSNGWPKSSARSARRASSP